MQHRPQAPVSGGVDLLEHAVRPVGREIGVEIGVEDVIAERLDVGGPDRYLADQIVDPFSISVTALLFQIAAALAAAWTWARSSSVRPSMKGLEKPKKGRDRVARSARAVVTS
ncbi:MAG: hypothetical protein R3D25_11900 [Geminicoccaceae bacterium]